MKKNEKSGQARNGAVIARQRRRGLALTALQHLGLAA